MKLFFVRNMYTAIMANSILNSQKIDSGVAVMTAPVVVDSVDEYQNNIESILKRNRKWVDIIKLEEFTQKNQFNYYPIRVIQNLITQRRSIANKVNQYIEIVAKYEIDEVVLVKLSDIREASLAYVADQSKIKLSIYDETIYSGYFSDVFSEGNNLLNHKKRMFKSMLKLFLLPLIFGKYLSVVTKFNKIDKIPFKSYYSLFQDFYPFNNVISGIKVIPEFDTIEIDSESILLTSSLSEDGIITLDEELKLIKYIASYLPIDTVIRFHPRDSQEKKNRILQLSGFRELDVQFEAAEMVLNNPKLKSISGYLTATLFVSSALRPELEINSFIGCINNGKINKLALKKINNDFPAINFHGI